MKNLKRIVESIVVWTIMKSNKRRHALNYLTQDQKKFFRSNLSSKGYETELRVRIVKSGLVNCWDVIMILCI